MSKVIEKTLANLWDSSRSYAMSSPLPEIYFSCGKALAVIEAEIEQRVKAAREDELRQFGLYLTGLPLKDESPLAFLNIMAQIGKRAKEIEATK